VSSTIASRSAADTSMPSDAAVVDAVAAIIGRGFDSRRLFGSWGLQSLARRIEVPDPSVPQRNSTLAPR
jgi:hypothetical protein